MNSWMCPVKPRSWKIIKKKGVFGAPKNAYKAMGELRIGDVIFFHVLKPINGIVAMARVISEMYYDNENLWGKDLYPYRVRIEIVHDLLAEKRPPITSSSFFEINTNKQISIEPYLRNVWIVPIANSQYELLTKSIQKE